MRKVFLLLVTFVILVLTAGCDKSNNDIEGKYVMYPDRNPHAIYFIEIIDKKAMINGHDAYELKWLQSVIMMILIQIIILRILQTDCT